MHTTLVTTAQLADHLQQWRVFDCRHDLAKPQLGAEQYRQSHIPGAAFASLDTDLSAPKNGKNGRHPLPQPEQFVQWLGANGVRQSDQVVCYDGANGAMAARLWWLLRWVGHKSVAVLDGGFAKWMKEGRPVSAEAPQLAPSKYPLSLHVGAVDVATVQKNLKTLFLLDARAPVRWRGEQEPIDPVAGRIPGAKNRFNMDNVTQDGVFKEKNLLKQELLKVLGNTPASDVVHYCGSGVAACHNLLAMEVAGLPGGKLYAGSWSEWSADPARPQERG
jgi:thiosulfate/3-mercaptopyruvate sulfurtransferase